MESAKLIEDATRGDEGALSSLLAKHLPDLNVYVRLRLSRKLRGVEDTIDIVQSVCRDVLQNARGFRYEGEAQFRTWLFNSAVRKILDKAEHWGAAKREWDRNRSLDATGTHGGLRFENEIETSFRTVCAPSNAAIGRETMDRIESAFAELAEDKQEVILLAKVVGMSRTQIAEQMGRSEAAIRNLLPRALSELAELADIA